MSIQLIPVNLFVTVNLFVSNLSGLTSSTNLQLLQISNNTKQTLAGSVGGVLYNSCHVLSLPFLPFHFLSVLSCFCQLSFPFMSFSVLSFPFIFLLCPCQIKMFLVFFWILHYLGPALDQGEGGFIIQRWTLRSIFRTASLLGSNCLYQHLHRCSSPSPPPAWP